jgi:nucleoside-diphosphate-sugar epimerase
VLHSQADIGKAERLLGYAPMLRIREGIGAAVPWYVKKLVGSPVVEDLGELAAEGS